MKKTTLILMIITIISKIFGFIRDITLSYFYGASNISDAYLISLTIPTIIFELIGIGINTSYIPIYSSIEKERDYKLAERFTNNIINIIIIICTIIILLVLLYTMPIVKLFASGFEDETLSLATRFTKISIFGIYFYSLIYILNGYLQSKNSFVVPALRGILLNLVIITAIVFSSKYGIAFLSIGSLIAMAIQFVFLVPFAYKKGHKYSFILDKNDEYLKKMLYLAIPVIIGVSVNQINILIDRTIASRIAIGGISALNYASRLNGFIQGIFVLSIATVMYPMISKMAAENNMNGLKKSLSEAISLINLLVLPATVGAVLFAEPVVKLLFGRGAFDSQAILMTSDALFFYSIGMIGFGLREVLSRAFYSLQDTKTPMMNAAVAMGLNIVLNIILSKFLGIGGLALATSISAIFCTGLLFISLRKKIGPFGIKSIIISFIKILCSSLLMGLIAKISYNILLNSISQNLSLILSIGIGAFSYFAVIYFMKIEDVDAMVYAMKKRWKRAAI